jgi:hypothetical protein
LPYFQGTGDRDDTLIKEPGGGYSTSVTLADNTFASGGDKPRIQLSPDAKPKGRRRHAPQAMANRTLGSNPMRYSFMAATTARRSFVPIY